MKTFICLLVILYTINDCYSQDVVYLDVGKPAPYAGYLFDSQREHDLRLLNDNFNYYKSLSDSLAIINKAQEDNINKIQDRVNIRDTEIESLHKQLADSDTGFFTKAGYFVLGALITGALAYGIYRSR